MYDYLQGKGIRCWLDEKQLVPGDDIMDEIDRGIQIWDKTILCCSENSLRARWWVNHEVEKALQKEKRLMEERKEKVLAMIPVRTDDFVFSDDFDSSYKSEIIRRHVGDFRDWKERDSFEAAADALIKALRLDKGQAAGLGSQGCD